jgi:hypothetical protein
MNNETQYYKGLPLSERIQLVEDIWDSIAEETPGAGRAGSAAGDTADNEEPFLFHVTSGWAAP